MGKFALIVILAVVVAVQFSTAQETPPTGPPDANAPTVPDAVTTASPGKLKINCFF
jgi:hypothetical protein